MNEIAIEMFDECLRTGQSARRVAAGASDGVRASLRQLARSSRVTIRTALLDSGVVVVARTDAALWSASAEVMRQKLTPR